MTSLATDFVRNFLCFDDFWPNAASAKSSHHADGLFLVISIMEGVMHTKKKRMICNYCKSSGFSI